MFTRPQKIPPKQNSTTIFLARDDARHVETREVWFRFRTLDWSDVARSASCEIGKWLLEAAIIVSQCQSDRSTDCICDPADLLTLLQLICWLIHIIRVKNLRFAMLCVACCRTVQEMYSAQIKGLNRKTNRRLDAWRKGSCLSKVTFYFENWVDRYGR